MNSAFHHGIVGALAILIMFCLYYGGKVLRQIIKGPRAVNRFLPKRHLGAKQTAIDSISGTVSSSKNNISELKQALIVIVLFGAIAGIEYLVNDYATIINVLIDPYFYSPYLFMGFALFWGFRIHFRKNLQKPFWMHCGGSLVLLDVFYISSSTPQVATTVFLMASESI